MPVLCPRKAAADRRGVRVSGGRGARADRPCSPRAVRARRRAARAPAAGRHGRVPTPAVRRRKWQAAVRGWYLAASGAGTREVDVEGGQY